MGVFKYEPIDLEGPAFRLLRLFKGTGWDDIECELFQAWLQGDSTIPYEALSYTWGSTEMTEHIKIEGRTLGVTKNLYLALGYLRSQDTDRIFWVDAVCIDQGNNKERGHQVQQMGNIYSQASRVIFWLGPATYEIKVLMDSLKQLEEESTKHAYRDWKLADMRWMDLWLEVQLILKDLYSDIVTQQRAGMEMLLERSWFRRVWILQEVANANIAVVCTGTRSVSARIFALAPSLVGVQPEPHCQAVLDIMPGPSRKNSWWSQKRDLYTLLLKFNGSQAGDPRDMIYALLGISSNVGNTSNLNVDYTKTVQQVIHDATLLLFGLSDSPHRTMMQFLCNFTFLNTTYLSKVAISCDANNIADFLKRRGGEVKITKKAVKAAAGNTQNGKEVMTVLLKQRGDEVKITEEVVKAAAENCWSGQKVMALLLEQRGDEVKITKEVVKAAVGNARNGKEVMTLLLKQRGEEVVRAAAQSGKEVMVLLLKQQGDEVKITEDVVKAAAGNTQNGEEVMVLLLEERVEGFKITEGLVAELARSFSARPMALLLEQRGDEVRVTEEVVKAAAGNWWGGEVMALLLKQRGDEVKVTEEVVKAAAGNIWIGEGVITILLEKRVQVKITEGLVIELARSFSARPIALLLKQQGDEVRVIEEVVKATAGNRRSGEEVITILLKKRVQVKITEGLVIELARSFSARPMALLFEQRGDEVRVTEEVVKAAAGNRRSEVMALLAAEAALQLG